MSIALSCSLRGPIRIGLIHFTDSHLKTITVGESAPRMIDVNYLLTEPQKLDESS